MRLIDADKLRKAIPAEEDNITGMGMTYDEMEAYNDGIDEQWEEIVNAPTIDAVEVVRCKDCKYWRDDHTCREHSLVSPMGANEFCSRGERGNSECSK